MKQVKKRKRRVTKSQDQKPPPQKRSKPAPPPGLSHPRARLANSVQPVESDTAAFDRSLPSYEAMQNFIAWQQQQQEYRQHQLRQVRTLPSTVVQKNRGKNSGKVERKSINRKKSVKIEIKNRKFGENLKI